MEDQSAPRGGGVHGLLKTSETHLTVLQVSDQFDQMPQRPSQPVESPDDKGVSGAGHFESLVQTGSGGSDPADLVDEDSLAAGGIQSILLKIEILVVSGNAGVADEYVAVLICSLVSKGVETAWLRFED